MEHVKARRSKKDKQKTLFFERCVPEGNEKAEELANGVAMLDGEMAQIRASTAEQKREEVHAALQCAACSLCLEEGPHGVVYGRRWIPLLEVRKEQ